MVMIRVCVCMYARGTHMSVWEENCVFSSSLERLKDKAGAESRGESQQAEPGGCDQFAPLRHDSKCVCDLR